MMRSPEQQFAMAKSLPMGELIKVLQGQSDSVDMSIAEMVLRQKTQAQKAMQGAQAMEMAQAPKVFQQDIAKAQQVMQPRMEQGVAALPVGGIGEIGNMNGAGGGIVAFDDGGSVQHYQNQGLVKGSQLALFPELVDEAAAAVPESHRASFTNALRKMFGMKGLGTLSGLYPLYELHSTGMDYDTGIGFGTPEEQMTIGTIPPSPRVRPVDKAAQEKATKEKPATSTTEKAPPVLQPPSSDVAKEEAGLGSLVDKFYGPAQKAKSLQDITQERLNLYKQLGIQEDPYAAAREALQKDRATDAEARREAGWSRLLEAGLGIMGGESPYALTNIGKGSQAAAKGAAEDMKEFRKIERERKKAEADYSIASNAYKKSGADTDLATAEKERARVDNLNMKRADAGMTVAVEQLKLKAQREGRLEDRDLKLYLGALERAGAFVKNNIDASTMSLDDLEKLVDSYAANIYSKYKAGNITAGMSGAAAVPSNVKVSREN
jgi:hypothetical protein